MNRRRWFVWRRTAVFFWNMLALLLVIDFCARPLKPEKGKEASGSRQLYSQSSDTVGNGSRTSAGCADGAKTRFVALTFDDGPHAVYTPMLLDGLKERNVRASFFLVGQNIDGKEEIVRRMRDEGHLIGNHSQSHMQLTAESAQAVCDQIEYTNRKIAAITGVVPSYIRPPYGSWSEELESMVPMTVALWNLDPLDWKRQDSAAVVRYVEEQAEDGSIVLLHDIYQTSVEAALEIVDRLSVKGYEFVTLDELLIE